MSDLVERAIAAHGGRAPYDAAREIAVEVRTGGAAFRSKRFGTVPPPLEMRCSTGEQRTVISSFPRPDQRAVFTADEVRIESAADGTVLKSRSDPRSRFPGGRRLLWWDHLDFTYFAGYAMWGYLNTPWVLARPDVAAREVEPWSRDGETWRRLEVTFPPGLHVHCETQTFYFDATGRLRRNDYTAEPFGRLARAAHMCDDTREWDGLAFPARRRVYPRRPDNRPAPFPTLVSLDVSRVEVG
jgi:hypothetical protein